MNRLSTSQTLEEGMKNIKEELRIFLTCLFVIPGLRRGRIVAGTEFYFPLWRRRFHRLHVVQSYCRTHQKQFTQTTKFQILPSRYQANLT